MELQLQGMIPLFILLREAWQRLLQERIMLMEAGERANFPLQPKREHIWDTAQNQTVRLRLGYTRCQFSIMTISEHYALGTRIGTI